MKKKIAKFRRRSKQLIENAMNDKSVYQKMVEDENAVWSHQLVDKELEALKDDNRVAGAQLGIGKGTNFAALCSRMDLKFENGLSVGCGAGRAERMLLEAGVCSKMTGVDVAEKAINAAKAKAKELGLPCEYMIKDVNFDSLGEEEYDLVIAQTSLHHVLHLENAAASINRALKPNGYLWIQDFIGENQFQFSQKRRAICDSILKHIPKEYRVNTKTGTPIQRVPLRQPGTLGSPFESIRSGEIEEVFKENFDLVYEEKLNSISSLIFPLMTRKNYIRSKEARSIFKIVLEVDDYLLKEGVLSGMDGRFLFRKKKDS